MSVPANISLSELVKSTHSLTETYYEIMDTCESTEEIVALNSWYWSAMHELWIKEAALEKVA